MAEKEQTFTDRVKSVASDPTVQRVARDAVGASGMQPYVDRATEVYRSWKGRKKSKGRSGSGRQ